MAKKLTIKTSASPAVIITRSAFNVQQLVYLAVANKPLLYPHGRSRIVYIGTTKNGIHRVASSAASKSRKMLEMHGVKNLSYYIVSCKSRQRVKTWHKLERGLLLTFREQYGIIPLGNTQGTRIKWTDEDQYFTRLRLRKVVKKYS